MVCETVLQDGQTPLMVACVKGFKDVVNALLRHPNVDVNQASFISMSAIIIIIELYY
jgi:ankyrin repeat protein